MRTVKEDVKLLRDIKDELFDAFNPDTISSGEMEQMHQLIVVVFENQNKWLLSDKISSEKQGRMDSYRQDKASQVGLGVSPGGEELPPTEPQKALAKRLGIDPGVHTKASISAAIDKAKRSKAEKMGE